MNINLQYDFDNQKFNIIDRHGKEVGKLVEDIYGLRVNVHDNEFSEKLLSNAMVLIKNICEKSDRDKVNWAIIEYKSGILSKVKAVGEIRQYHHEELTLQQAIDLLEAV